MAKSQDKVVKSHAQLHPRKAPSEGQQEALFAFICQKKEKEGNHVEALSNLSMGRNKSHKTVIPHILATLLSSSR